MSTDAQDPIAERLAAVTVGPDDRLLIALPDASQDDLQAVFEAIKGKGFDMDRVLIIGGPDIQLAVVADTNRSAQ